MTAVSERVSALFGGRNSALFSVLSAFYMGFPGFKLRLRFVLRRSAVKPFLGGAPTNSASALRIGAHAEKAARIGPLKRCP